MIKYLKNGIEINNEFISLDEICRKCIEVNVKDNDLIIFNITWGSTRGFDGCNESIVIKKQNVEQLKDILIGKFIYFGEIAGKHSEVCGDLLEKHITIETNVNNVIDFILKNPNYHSYDHSFLHTFQDDLSDGRYSEEYNGDDIIKISKLLNTLIKID